MKSVESPNAQLCSVSPGQLGAMLKSLFWKSNFDPQPAVPVLLKALFEAVGFAPGDHFTKDVLFDSVSPLGDMQWRQPQP